MDVGCGGMRMKEDFAVMGRGRWINAVVMRFDGSCLDEKGWEQGV